MVHRGVHFSIEEIADGGVWRWEYQIGEKTKSGRIETQLRKHAIRNVHRKIDRDLRELHLQLKTKGS